MALITPLAKTTLVVSVIMGMFSLSACETIPKPVTQAPVTQQSASRTVTNKGTTSQNDVATNHATAKNVITEDDYVRDDEINSYPNEPYIIPKLPTTSEPPIKPAPTTVTPNPNVNITPPPVIPPSHSDLLERARQNSKSSKPQNATTASNHSGSVAFQNLMTTGINELKSDQLTAAENSFTRAQRLNPKSSAVYFYLSQVAFKKNQPRKAEAMARRGLSFTTDAGQRQALWQLILRSGQLQNNTRVIQEAQKALH